MRLLVSGYYGFGNIGDEAILAAIAARLPQHVPDSEVTVLSADPGHTLRVHGLPAVDRWRPGALLGQLRRTDLLLQGGGGLIQDASSFLSPAYYLGVLALSRLTRTPFVIFCQGLGPLSSRLWRRVCTALFHRAAEVIVRDPHSAQLLADWGLKRQTQVSSDPAILLEPASPEDTRAWLEASGSAAESWDLVVVPRAVKEFEPLLRQTLRASAAAGLNVLVLPFQTGDEPLARSLASEIDRAQAVPTPQSPQIAAAVVSRSAGVIAARVHALIFAAAAGVPAVGLCYDPKVANWCAQVGYRYVGPEDAAAMQRWIEDLPDDRLGPSRDAVAECRTLAERAFALVGEVCKRLRG